jgi:hypothetical protein
VQCIKISLFAEIMGVSFNCEETKVSLRGKRWGYRIGGSVQVDSYDTRGLTNRDSKVVLFQDTYLTGYAFRIRSDIYISSHTPWGSCARLGWVQRVPPFLRSPLGSNAFSRASICPKRRLPRNHSKSRVTYIDVTYIDVTLSMGHISNQR